MGPAGLTASKEVRTEVFAAWPEGALRTEVALAVDVYAPPYNIDVFNTLTIERGWSAEQVE